MELIPNLTIWRNSNNRFNYSMIPRVAGLYRYFGSQDELLYVGISKDLRERTKNHMHQKNQVIERNMDQVGKIDFIFCDRDKAIEMEFNILQNQKPIFNISTSKGQGLPQHWIPRERGYENQSNKLSKEQNVFNDKFIEEFTKFTKEVDLREKEKQKLRDEDKEHKKKWEKFLQQLALQTAIELERKKPICAFCGIQAYGLCPICSRQTY